MQNNQQQYLRPGNYEFSSPNNYSIGHNWNNQQRFNYDGNGNRTMNDYNQQRCVSSTSPPYQQNSGYYSQQCCYGYGCPSTGTVTSNNGYYGQQTQFNNRGQVVFHPMECCTSKDNNRINQYGELNPYNCFDMNTNSPSSLTNRALNIHTNGLYNHFPNSNSISPSSCSSNQTTSGAGDLASNSFEHYQRKSS